MQNVIDLSTLTPLQPETPPFKLIKVSDLTAQPKPIDWLLDGILEAGSLNLLFGEPASGKSLFAFDWALCIASGRDWLGKETQKRDVVILAGEGHSGLRRRMRALEVKHGIKTPDNLLVSEIPANLTDVAQAQWVTDAIAQNCTNGGLVIVDTLNRNMGAADENNAKDIAELLNIIDGCIRSMGLAVLIVHHSGHSNQGRARGSSAIRAAVDAEFCVTKKADSITLGCTKAKDFEPFKDMEFSLKVTELGDQWHDKVGQPITSVYLEYKGETSNTSKAKKHLNKKADAILTSLMDAIREHGISAPSDIKAKFAGFNNDSHKVISLEIWRPIGHKATISDSGEHDAIKKAFNRAKNQLIELGKIQQYNGFCWVVHD